MKHHPLAIGLLAASALSVMPIASQSAGQQPATPPPAAAPPAQAATPTPRPRFVWPERMQNARVLPATTGGQQLRAMMVGFSIALDVNCSHCHEGGDDVPMQQRNFASDANPRKEIARGMMRMMQRLNGQTLPRIGGLSAPQVTCYTCHRGATEPATAPPPPPAPAPARPAAAPPAQPAQ